MTQLLSLHRVTCSPTNRRDREVSSLVKYHHFLVDGDTTHDDSPQMRRALDSEASEGLTTGNKPPVLVSTTIYVVRESPCGYMMYIY